MPKMKTHKGLKKRVKVTATGKLKRHHSGASHLLAGKSAKRRRALRGTAIMSHAMAPKLRILLGK
jgi:large subunit ribosomal protein L35